MSEETGDDVEKAIKAHYSSETGGGMLTDWTLAMTGIGMSSERPAEYVFGSSATPVHSLIGLAYMNYDYQKDRLLEDDDED